MSDVERLRAWMDEHQYTMKSLSRAMNMRYITLYVMMVRNNKVNERFITRFIQYFGCEEAVTVFRDALTLQSQQG